MHDITQYSRSENFKYLVIEASHGDYYGFNTSVKKECEMAMNIVNDKDDFMVKGWKVSKKFPEWVKNAASWNAFINLEDVNYMEENEGETAYNVVKGGHGKDYDGHEENRKRNDEAVNDRVIDDYEEDEEDEEDEDNDNGEDEVEGYEEEEDAQEEFEGENGEEEGEQYEEEDYEDEELVITLCENDDRFPYRKGEPRKGEFVEPSKKGNDKKASKKGNDKDKKQNHSRGLDIFDNLDEDASFFASINADDLKKEVAKNVKSSIKTNTVDIYITGPFRNATTGKSIWIAVFGDYGSAWTLKSQFLQGYISTLLKRINMPNINISHTDSFHDINIRKYEYGEESLWKRNDKNKTTKRLSFVFTCDTTNEQNGKKGLIEAVQFFFKTMKKRENNPIGPLVVEFLKDHASSLYNYLLKKKPNEELVAKDITDDIDKHFHAGFVTHWDDYLNHWMVDYDIIRILKEYAGYSSWSDVPMKQRGLCYKNYNQNATLPAWDIDQERY